MNGSSFLGFLILQLQKTTGVGAVQLSTENGTPPSFGQAKSKISTRERSSTDINATTVLFVVQPRSETLYSPALNVEHHDLQLLRFGHAHEYCRGRGAF
jgi:hypothetical protein